MEKNYLKLAEEGLNDWWRYSFVVIGIIIAYIVGQFPLMFALLRSIQQDESLGSDAVNEFMSNPDFTAFGIGSNTGFLLMLLSFLFAFPLFYYLFISLHQRQFTGLISHLKKLRWKRILFAFGLWFLLGSLAESYNYFSAPDDYTFQFAWKPFLILTFISIFLLPIQTSLEEFIFRGYVMQGVGRWVDQPWIPLLISSLLFALVHGSNPEVTQYGFLQMQVYYLIAGLFLGIITILDNSLELALGVHAATNIFGAMFLSYEGAALQTHSLFRTSSIDPIMMTILFTIMAIVFIVICSRIFKWPSISFLLKNQEYYNNKKGLT